MSETVVPAAEAGVSEGLGGALGGVVLPGAQVEVAYADAVLSSQSTGNSAQCGCGHSAGGRSGK